MAAIVKTAKNEHFLIWGLDFRHIFAILRAQLSKSKCSPMFSMSKTSVADVLQSLETADAETVVRQLFVVSRGETTESSRELSARLMERFLVACDLTPPRLAQEIGVAPQTVNRWLTAKITPRVAQVLKLQALTQRNSIAAGPHPINRGDDLTRFLGVRPLEYVMNLEAEANAVWIVSNGYLHEANRGAVGEKILQALRQGVHFRYVFHQRSEAADAFSRLQSWLKTESFAEYVMGYVIKSRELAYEIGLSVAPGAWIAIEYSPLQAARLQRASDVFHALSVREYADTEKCRVKNDDGQSCWVELPAPMAQRWQEHLNEMATSAADNPDIAVRRVSGQSRRSTRSQMPCKGNSVIPKATSGAGWPRTGENRHSRNSALNTARTESRANASP